MNGNQMAEAVFLLNELNQTVMKHPRKLDDVVMASALMLASALRQIGGAHGEKRMRDIINILPHLMDDSNAAMAAFFNGQ